MRFRVSVGLLALVFFSGCATPMHEVVRDEVKYGDSEDRVREILGAPTSFSSMASNGSTTWTYESSGAVCKVKFEKNKVNDSSCDASQYMNPVRKRVGLFFQGFAEGYNASRQKASGTYKCKPDLLGGYNCYEN